MNNKLCLALLLIHASYCGSWQVVQTISTLFSGYSISYDNQWVVQTAAGSGSIYKFNGATFTKLAYTITGTSNAIPVISVNSYGNFFLRQWPHLYL